jgi:NAD(P)-dependent dehydrogenase (short-subunit alcohol dehydrogenase family)
VTGAGSGIGEATARLLAQRGAAVGLVDLRAEAVLRVAGELEAAGARAIGRQCDVASEDGVARTVSAIADELGGLDTVVAAAGIVRPAQTHALSLQEWETTIRVNLTGTFLTLKHALPRLRSAGGGTIVTVGSVASLVVGGRAASYDASKGGVLQLTRAIAAEYADRNIRANCVCPGAVETPMAQNSVAAYGEPAAGSDHRTVAPIRRPTQRRADPSEIAAVVAFLCDDAASFMTGAALPVDGGYTAV